MPVLCWDFLQYFGHDQLAYPEEMTPTSYKFRAFLSDDFLESG